MYTIIRPLREYFKIKQIRIYDAIFILHSKVTVALLLMCCIFLSAKQYFGDSIECIVDGKKDFASSYCWVLGTYILDNFKEEVLHGGEVVGVGIGSERGQTEDHRIYQRYYQWVSLILVLQAIFFYIPAFLWKIWEGGRLEQLCNELGNVIIPDEWRSRRRDVLVEYFSTNYKDIHICYAFRYFMCELLNFLISVFNIILMNIFFSGFWLNFIPALGVMYMYDWNKWNRLSSRVFPKLAKCEFFKYGYSGTIEKYDALCLLPLNILNEKIFAFLWFWFLLLTILSGINVLFRLFTIFSRSFRLQIIRSQLRSMSSHEVNSLLSDANIGDWFILYKVCCNINPVLFQDLMQKLSTNKRTMRNKIDEA